MTRLLFRRVSGTLAGPQGLQQRPKPLSRPEDPRLHGTHRRPGHLGNLLVVETLDIAQHHRHPQVVGQRRQRAIDSVARDEPRLGIRLTGRHRAGAQGLGVVVETLIPGSLPTATPIQGGPRGVGGDRVEPGLERALASKSVQRPVRADKRLLRHVLRLSSVAHHRQREVHDPRLIPPNQGLERVEAPGNGRVDQRAIRIHLVLHALDD